MLKTTIYKSSSILKSKTAPYGKYLEREKIKYSQLTEMYLIYEKYYENTKFSIFEADFKKKSGAILIFHPITNQVVGFSTVVVQHFYLDGKNYTTLFSGDTVIEKEFWGTRALQSTMLKLLIKLRVSYPFNELYWLLISKGYKTYLLLANNYYVYYPHVKGKHSHLANVIDHYCKSFFSQYYDQKTGLINFGDDYQPLKGEVAPITDEMRLNNPKIRFFEKMNPTWIEGTELPCIGEIAWKDLARYPMRFFTKPMSKGKTEAVLAKMQLAKE
ncbi:hypothetical protein [Acinetobacter ursingii]|uniref:hypothetical protein n=1 Tax=Acinetobacter ursingii TaxID=108980 RepID=UPI00124FB161|nr:hypothetical protein [Acinetobacter ursingii]